MRLPKQVLPRASRLKSIFGELYGYSKYIGSPINVPCVKSRWRLTTTQEPNEPPIQLQADLARLYWQHQGANKFELAYFVPAADGCCKSLLGSLEAQNQGCSDHPVGFLMRQEHSRKSTKPQTRCSQDKAITLLAIQVNQPELRPAATRRYAR